MEVVRSVPLYKQVYNKLRKEFIIGQVDPDSIINEVHLARDLNVSRGPVREAIRLLEKEGLIIRDSKNQLRPYKPTLEDIKNIYQCRQVLESLAVKLTSERVNANIIGKLTEIIGEKKKLMYVEVESEEKSKKFAHLCTEFHDMINNSCGNPRLQQQIQQLKSLTYLYRHYNTKGKARREQVFEDHNLILSMFKEERFEEVEQFMNDHIGRDLENLISIFNKKFEKEI